MPLNITDLNNAKLDVDHIGNLANSPALTATDRMGNAKMTWAGVLAQAAAVDVASLAQSPFLRGINVISSSATGMSNANCKANIAAAFAAGVQRVALVPVWFQANATATAIASTANSPSDQAITDAAAYARSLGMRVTLKPHLNLSDSSSRSSIAPATPVTWWTNYSAFILHYAALAEQIGAELFTVGVELTSMNNSTHEANWRTLVASVRAVFSGSITYSANRLTEAVVTDWYDAVDFVGVDLYDPVTTPPGTANPGVPALVDAWYAQGLVGLIDRIHRKFGKPIIFTEVGYYSRTDTAGAPATISAAATSEQAQADAYEAAFRVLGSHRAVKGIYLWTTSPNTSTALGGYEFLPATVSALVPGVLKRYWRNGPVGQKPGVSIAPGAKILHQTDIGVTDASSLVMGLNAPLGTAWGVAEYDTDRFWDLSSFRSRLTVSQPGLYRVTGQAIWDTNTTGHRRLRIMKNGSEASSDTKLPVSGSTTRQQVVAEEFCAAGDFFTLEVFQNSGGSLNIKGTSGPVFLAISRIG